MASVWAIGDIHGEYDRLSALLDYLPRKADDVTLFLGDYIDRGPNSAAVVARVLDEHDRAPDRTILLWGNHEDMAAAHWGLPVPSPYEYDPNDWFRNGGIETLLSYGVPGDSLDDAPCPPSLARLFSLLQTFWRAPVDRFPELSSVIWVHAGVLPGQNPEDAGGEILLWVREDFLKATDSSGRLVIHGHTPTKQIVAQSDKIGIDTGAVYGGLLSALQLPERHVYQIDTDEKVNEWPLP